jgi:hypothetical protein
MSYELTGTLIEIFDTEQPTPTFRKREFVVELQEDRNGRQFFDHIKFQVIQDKVDLLDQFQVKQEVKVHFDIKGKRWEREGRVSYFTNLQAWRIEAADSNVSPSGEGVDADPGFPTMDDAPPSGGDQPYDDDLPF